jgi:hypothetical protein
LERITIRFGCQHGLRLTKNYRLVRYYNAIASEAQNQPTQTHQHEDVVRYFRKMGIHPDQAPDIFAPAAKANAFLAKTAKAQRELMDF